MKSTIVAAARPQRVNDGLAKRSRHITLRQLMARGTAWLGLWEEDAERRHTLYAERLRCSEYSMKCLVKHWVNLHLCARLNLAWRRSGPVID